MTTKKTSIAWTLDHDTLQEIINQSNSMVMILTKIGLNAYNGSGRTLYRRIFETDEFDLITFDQNRKQRVKAHFLSIHRKPLEHFLDATTSYNRSALKRRLIQDKIIEYQCRDCSNTGSHNGKKLSLQLEHIDGNNKNNKLENLCFLCPNCHSQTPTYAGKKNYKPKVYETEVTRLNRFEKSRKFHITKEELEILVAQHPMTTIGKMLGVSDNAVRKRCRVLGIQYR
jgi:5-methylcytosine-specific restriction endonuclease McrA